MSFITSTFVRPHCIAWLRRHDNRLYHSFFRGPNQAVGFCTWEEPACAELLDIVL